MKIYQVGGSVRDMLLNRKPHDIDYVVVGSSVEEMTALGFKQVGKDFPVFLHPQTKQEYALARKEIKTGPKHTDFEFQFDKSITLEDDLLRRDFSVNALALDLESGEIIDLFGGKEDLKNKVLRHVNDEHFAEDPLRALRLCRFAAQLDFCVAPETLQIVKQMCQTHQLEHLYAERIWQEIEKALVTDDFEKFIRTARESGVLKAVLPEVYKLWLTPELKSLHPEGNTGEHTMLALQWGRGYAPEAKFALLLHDVGKSVLPSESFPEYERHESAGIKVIEEICNRLKVPNRYRDFAKIFCRYHSRFLSLKKMKAEQTFDYVCKISDSCKDYQRMRDFIRCCKCDIMATRRKRSYEERMLYKRADLICKKIYKITAATKATDMPNFNELPKNAEFGRIYRDFLISKIKE